MTKCDTSAFTLNYERMAKIKDQDVIYVSVTEDLNSCAKIDTRKIEEGADGANVTNLTGALYNAANVPQDEFGCSANKCANTGTYQGGVTTAATSVVIGNFRKTMDGSLYGAGILTAYVLLPDGDHKVSVDIADYTESGWDNYNTVDYTVHATKGGTASALYPVLFDLADLGTATGTGWSAGTVGVKLRVTIDGANLKANDRVGVSSFAFYEGLEDLEINKMIGLSCVNTLGDTLTYDVVEAGCSYSEYNTTTQTITFSATVNNWTHNFNYLIPNWHTTDETEAGIPRVVTRTVIAGTGELAGYGVIQLSDMVEGECDGIIVQTPGCANNSSELDRISSPIPVPFSEGDSDKFQVLSTSYNGDSSLGMILVGQQWIGQDLNVIYRQRQEAEVSEITNEFREFKCNILAPFRKKDGTTEWHKYENAFITTTGDNISRTDDSTREVQFTIAANENGVKKKIIKLR